MNLTYGATFITDLIKYAKSRFNQISIFRVSKSDAFELLQ